jgi:hypothetical protein
MHPEATITLDLLGLGEEIKKTDANSSQKSQTLDPDFSPSFKRLPTTASVRVLTRRRAAATACGA